MISQQHSIDKDCKQAIHLPLQHACTYKLRHIILIKIILMIQQFLCWLVSITNQAGDLTIADVVTLFICYIVVAKLVFL